MTALASPVMLGVWLASFPDLRGVGLWTALAAIALPYAVIVWFLRKGATRIGIAMGAGTAGLLLLLSPVFAFFLFGTMIGAIGMSFPIAFLGAEIVISHIALLFFSIRLLLETPPPRRPLIAGAVVAFVGMSVYTLGATLIVRSVL